MLGIAGEVRRISEVTCNTGPKYVVSERKEFAGKKHSKLEI